MNFKKSFSFICILLILALSFTACGSSNETGTDGNNTEQKESIIVNGSTSVQPIAEELAKAYKEKHPNATIDIQGGGSSVGIKSATDGVVDIGMASRQLKEEEKPLVEHTIAVDGIAVVVNPANGIENLTLEQIKMIYMGEVANWKEVGGSDANITVVTREQGSGTRGAFIELTKLQVKEDGKKVDKTTAAAITQGSTGAVMTTVASDPNAIGFASYGSAKENKDVKMIKVEGVEISEKTLSAGEFKIARPFLMVSKEAPTGLGKSFIEFILSDEGQDIVVENGYLKATK